MDIIETSICTPCGARRSPIPFAAASLKVRKNIDHFTATLSPRASLSSASAERITCMSLKSAPCVITPYAPCAPVLIGNVALSWVELLQPLSGFLKRARNHFGTRRSHLPHQMLRWRAQRLSP